MRTEVWVLLAIMGLIGCGGDGCGGKGVDPDEPDSSVEPEPDASMKPEPMRDRDPGPEPKPKRDGGTSVGGSGGSPGPKPKPNGKQDAGPPVYPTVKGNPCNADPCAHGSCEPTSETEYVCDCDPGWIGRTCSTNQNDCANSPCEHGVCKDEVSGFSCECSAGWSGTRCDHPIDHCKQSDCMNGGLCVNETMGYACDCPHGFSGERCEHKVVTCTDNPCAHGACMDYGYGYECVCQPGYGGVHCTVNEDDCAGVTECGPYGACVDGIGGYNCVCQAGWTGPLCDQNVDDCASHPCKNGGTCVDGSSAFSCKCDDVNWTGPTCAINIDRCAGNNACGAHGTCKDTLDGFECVCAANWYGSDCSHKQDYCVGNACQNGTCVSLADSYQCNCSDGWEGSHCEQKIDPCSRCTADQVCKSGSCVTGVVVPNLIDLGMDAAGDAIVHAKLQRPLMPDFTDRDEPLGEHGFVIIQDPVNPRVRVLDQRPAPGTLVAEGTPVALRMAIPPDDKRFLQDPLTNNNDNGETAEAYYRTIDPHGTRDTLTEWIDANGFNDPNAEKAQVIYQNTVDLGFVRDMHMAKRDGRIAFYVKNHPSFAAFRKPSDPVATVAMEYGTVNGSTKPFVTFYTFRSNGDRISEIDLDNSGVERSQPGVCLTCHGGFSGNTLPKSSELFYPNGGDTGARFIPFDLSLLAYENNEALGSTRAAQEEAFRKMNLAIRESYGDTDTHAKELIDGWYANSTTFNDNFVPPGWMSQLDLYTTVVKSNCRLCHSQQSRARDFRNAEEFLQLKDNIRTHIFERSTMPLARRTFYDFWVSYPHAPTALAAATGGHPKDGAAVTGYLSLDFEPVQTAIIGSTPITIKPTKAAFVDTIEYTLQAGDPTQYTLTRIGTVDVSFEILGAPTSSDLVTIEYNARGRNGEVKTGSFDIAVIPSTKKLSFFEDGVAGTWAGLPCGSCHVNGGPAQRAFIFNQPDDLIRACLSDPTGASCSQTFVSKIIPGAGSKSPLIRVPLDRPNVVLNGITVPHPLLVDADTSSRLQQIERWISDGALR